MSFLDDLNEQERQVLVRLPYRIGLYISEADDAGGDVSDQQEKQTLSNIIHGFAADVFGAEAIQFVISATVNSANEWDGWNDSLDAVLAESNQAVDLMKTHVGEKEARAFGLQMYDIAEAVAMAFTEEEHLETFMQRARMLLAYVKARYLEGSERSYEEFISISALEREALKKLSFALGVGKA